MVTLKTFSPMKFWYHLVFYDHQWTEIPQMEMSQVDEYEVFQVLAEWRRHRENLAIRGDRSGRFFEDVHYIGMEVYCEET